VVSSPTDVTLAAPPATDDSVSSRRVSRLTVTPQKEEQKALLLGYRRALAIGSMMWCSFIAIDVAVVRFEHAGELSRFVFVRIAVLAVLLAVLLQQYRPAAGRAMQLTAADLITTTAATAGTALLCAEFHGIASPYMPGVCLVVLARTVTSQDPWRRGLVMTGVPIAAFFAVLFGSALFSRRIAAQLSDPAALTTLGLNAAYILGTYVFLVAGGDIVWSLRRQVFEARSLGRYRLKKRIATGGMGDVWLAYHPGLKGDVALKILKREEQERSSGALARFEREVRATAELKHPNTVRVFDYGTTEDGLCYYVMELLEGETLAQHVLRCGPLPAARAVHVVGQAARALAEAHERGIVHRDVKPENIFLTSLGGEHDFVKVIDFGIAKVDYADGTKTDTGWVLGTPMYMSPEVATGEAADARSDVYALGAVLYFVLCGQAPFEADNAAALIFAHVHEAPTRPSVVLGRLIPRDLEDLVMKTLEKDPAARFPTCADLALALAACGVAGKWTFGDAVDVARKSSRPPPPNFQEQMPSLKAPLVPKFATGK
jgi:hypothetical protein